MMALVFKMPAGLELSFENLTGLMDVNVLNRCLPTIALIAES